VLTGRRLHFDDPAKADLLSAVLAALVALACPKVKPRAEWLVDRLFFGPRAWRSDDVVAPARLPAPGVDSLAASPQHPPRGFEPQRGNGP
jgi:hypothetical protein